MQSPNLPLLPHSRPAAQDHGDWAEAVLRLRGDAPVLGLAAEDRAGHCAAQKGGVAGRLRDAGSTIRHERRTGHEALAAPRKKSIAPSDEICNTVFVTKVEIGTFTRKIDFLRRIKLVAVLSHGDFLPTVGRAWRGAQRIGQTCISTVLGYFRRLTARQGLSFCKASRTRGTQSAPGFQGWQREQFQSTV